MKPRSSPSGGVNGPSSSHSRIRPHTPAFQNLKLYRPYLTPPSNPFREGKSRMQALREALLILLIVSLVVTLILWSLPNVKATKILEETTELSSSNVASFESQQQQASLRGAAGEIETMQRDVPTGQAAGDAKDAEQPRDTRDGEDTLREERSSDSEHSGAQPDEGRDSGESYKEREHNENSSLAEEHNSDSSGETNDADATGGKVETPQKQSTDTGREAVTATK